VSSSSFSTREIRRVILDPASGGRSLNLDSMERAVCSEVAVLGKDV
jgi:hypothetical protein